MSCRRFDLPKKEDWKTTFIFVAVAFRNEYIVLEASPHLVPAGFSLSNSNDKHMKIFKLLLLSVLAGACMSHPVAEQQSQTPAPLYQQFADSEMLRNPDPRLIEFREKPKWEYTHGLILLATLRVYEKTGAQQYLDYVKSYADSMITEDGNILTYKLSDYNIDRLNPGRVLLALNKLSPTEKYSKALALLREQVAGQPRTAEGGFWHKKIYPYQMWLDGLYMGSPFIASYAQAYDEPALYDDVVNQILLMDAHNYSPEAKLYYHAWDEQKAERWANKETGQSPEFWGRAMGWYAMALVDVLDYLPQDHPQRTAVISVVNKVAEGLALYQDEKTGVWYQVLDKAGQEGNYAEASCSSMFSYFLLKAVNKGYLSKDYEAIAVKAYEGVLSEFVKNNDDGTVSLTHICAVAGLGGDPYREGTFEYYVNEPQRDNDPKGVGPLIMAALEYETMKAL